MNQTIQKLIQLKSPYNNCVTFFIPKNDKIQRYHKMLADEFTSCSKIPNRLHRNTMLQLIAQLQESIKEFDELPENGLFIAGTNNYIKIFTGKTPIEISIFVLHNEIIANLIDVDQLIEIN